MTSPEHYTQVPVPTELVVDVMALITARFRPDGVAGIPATLPEEPGTDIVELTSIPWSVDDLARLAGTPLPTTRAVAQILDVLAKEPGGWFTTTQLVELTGHPRDTLKGVLSALTRHVHTRYGRTNWPMTFAWGPSLGVDGPGEAHYRLDTEEEAARWREARGGHE